MMGYVPDLHRIWGGTSDQQLIALLREFPGVYRYARIMEEASEAERNKASRPYDGMAEFSEQHKQMGAQLLTTGATLERGYQAFRANGNLQAFRPQLDELGRLHRQLVQSSSENDTRWWPGVTSQKPSFSRNKPHATPFDPVRH